MDNNQAKKTQNNSIRIKDIALKAGVSIGTVDRVLHNRGEVSEKTRRKVMEIVRELDYKPNIIARSLASKRAYYITVLIPDYKTDNPYWKGPLDGIRRAADEIKDFNFSVEIKCFDIGSENSFQAIVANIDKEHPDALIIAPVFHHSAISLTKTCEQKKIPYVFIDSMIEDLNYLSFFGQDAFQSGYLAAKLLNYAIKSEQRILVLKLRKREGNINHLLNREDGFMTFFRENNSSMAERIISKDIDISVNKSFENTFNSTLNEFENIGGIFVTNSKVNLVAGFFEQRNISKRCILIGYDTIHENIQYLEKDLIDFLIGQKPEEQGYQAAMTIFNYLVQQKEVERKHFSPLDIITKENYKYYLNYNI
jgi:LacI family transcriptional regulator